MNLWIDKMHLLKPLRKSQYLTSQISIKSKEIKREATFRLGNGFRKQQNNRERRYFTVLPEANHRKKHTSSLTQYTIVKCMDL